MADNKTVDTIKEISERIDCLQDRADSLEDRSVEKQAIKITILELKRILGRLNIWEV